MILLYCYLQLISRCGVSMNSTQSFVLYRAGLFGFFALTLTNFQCRIALLRAKPRRNQPLYNDAPAKRRYDILRLVKCGEPSLGLLIKKSPNTIQQPHLRTFATIATAHLCCARYSLGTLVLRHASSARSKEKT